MYIKVVTVKVKVKGKRAKKVYRYVRVVERGAYTSGFYQKERVIATLGTLQDVRFSQGVLIHGLQSLSEA